MIPGGYFLADGEITLNADREAVTLDVANTGDRPVQVARTIISRDRSGARLRPRGGAGVRLDIVERSTSVQAVADAADPLRRRRAVVGFRAAVMGPLEQASSITSGSCQCGAVAFEVDVEVAQPMVCNCSCCRRLGSRLAFAPRELQTAARRGHFTEYLFNKHAIRHLFCKTGIEVLRLRRDARRHPDGGDQRQLPRGVDPLALPTTFFDGRSA